VQEQAGQRAGAGDAAAPDPWRPNGNGASPAAAATGAEVA
jgi:hypothetical protein